MKKNKKIIIVLALAAAFAVWYFWLRKSKNTPANTTQDNGADLPTPVTETFAYGGKKLTVPGFWYN